ncbi:uncharacterized protein [Drosophila virilis]|uniref:MYCBP-associated protein n=1 Tax=Drosophila virilis TaxID=7244 RepID=B4MFF8_DROVI|nr:uncharacterized protein LOC6636510 [Drosophila virilis]EDW57327.1 uncharacterized protein Dvir_GJ15153 [Drosophila virilis]
MVPEPIGQTKKDDPKIFDTLYTPLTLVNFTSNAPSTRQSLQGLAMGQLQAGASMSQYSERIVEDILAEIFAERHGQFPETSSSCHPSKVNLSRPAPELHVDKRLKYWRDMLQTRRQMQKRVELQTGKSPEQVLFNRRSTLDHRNKETVRRLMDYAERLRPEKLVTKPISALKELQDPCTCELIKPIDETWPQAEKQGATNVEIIGLPEVTQQELLGADSRKLRHSWMKSGVLDTRIDEQFRRICKVLEFFPDLEQLQVKGTNIAKLQPKARTELLHEEQIVTITTSTENMGSEEQPYESWMEALLTEPEPEPEPPEIGLMVNGKEYVVCDKPFTECFELLTKFNCDPYQRRIKHVLKLKNIGKQALSFKWSQGVYYYNRGSLLLAQDNEFLFDTDNFRLTYGESYNLIVMYQPRKVSMAVELWRLQVEPRIFCGSQESMLLRFHGRCRPPREYMARLKELHCMTIGKANELMMKQLTGHLAELVPLIEPPPACCPYERTLDEREVFNSLNPGYNCMRFDDLEVLKSMHKHLKKPREPHWDLRLDTIKMFIMRIESLPEREEMFGSLMVILESVQGTSLSLECADRLNEQKQRTRFIYVRGAICNGIEEWEDLVSIIEESYYKPELRRYYIQLMEEAEEDGEDLNVATTKIDFSQIDINQIESYFDSKTSAAVIKKLHRSKYFRDALYIQTYSHLCNMAENIVSIIESTDVVPT